MLCKPKPLDPDFSRIRQKFKILIWYLFLDFGPNSKTTKKIQIGGGAKKGQKKSALVVCSFKFRPLGLFSSKKIITYWLSKRLIVTDQIFKVDFLAVLRWEGQEGEGLRSILFSSSFIQVLGGDVMFENGRGSFHISRSEWPIFCVCLY